MICVPGGQLFTATGTEAVVRPGYQRFGRAIPVVVLRLVRRAGGEELERGEPLDVEAVAELALRICIDLSNDQRGSASEILLGSRLVGKGVSEESVLGSESLTMTTPLP